MKRFDNIPPNQFSLLAALMGLLLTIELDVNEQNAIGNFFLSLGQSVLTSASQFENRKQHNLDNNEICDKIDSMSNELNELKKQLRKKY